MLMMVYALDVCVSASAAVCDSLCPTTSSTIVSFGIVAMRSLVPIF